MDLWFEGLPQFVFMICTFGYMVFAIIIKWLQNWEGRESVSIIALFINFFEVDNPLYESASFQTDLQYFLALVSFLCVILMLVPKPIINAMHAKQVQKTLLHQDREIDQEHKLIESQDS